MAEPQAPQQHLAGGPSRDILKAALPAVITGLLALTPWLYNLATAPPKQGVVGAHPSTAPVPAPTAPAPAAAAPTPAPAAPAPAPTRAVVPDAPAVASPVAASAPPVQAASLPASDEPARPAAVPAAAPVAGPSPIPALLDGDFERAVALAQADDRYRPLRPGLASFAEAGRLMRLEEWVAARNALRRAEATPELRRASFYWRCRLAKAEKGLPADAQRCLEEAGLRGDASP
jgi:hypothetical protein